MNKNLKSLVLMPSLLFSLASLHAQNDESDKDIKNENIIIHKKNPTKEKVTVVIDGDNITVNGKPVDDFKSADIDIIKQGSADDYDNYAFGYGGSPVIAPVPPNAELFRKDMMQKIKSNKAFFGVMTEKTDKGAKITEVTKGSAAEKAGLKEGDIITKIGDDAIADPDDLYKAVGKRKPDDKITVTYLRDNKNATASATLGKSDQMRVYSWNAPNNDFNFKNFGPGNFSFAWGDKPRLGVAAQDTEDGNGVKILEIDDEDSPAAKAGLKEDDIITQVNGKAIASTDDLRDAVKNLKKGDTVKITYKRNNQTQTVDVKFPKDLKTVDL